MKRGKCKPRRRPSHPPHPRHSFKYRPLVFSCRPLYLGRVRHFFLFLICMIISLPAFAVEVRGFRVGEDNTGARIVLELTESVQFRSFTLTNPDRVMVDLPLFRWATSPPAIPANSQFIKAVRYGALGAGQARIVIETKNPSQIKSTFIIPPKNGPTYRLVVDISPVAAQTARESQSQVLGVLRPPARDDTPTNNDMTLEENDAAKNAPSFAGGSSKAHKPLIIIDPGHGGPDPGATAVNGLHEKTIVLSIGKELRDSLLKSGRYRVMMTRDRDIFIPLRGRVNFARKHKGDLFVSIHADSIGNAATTGASVYTLSNTASDAETAKLAERENKSDLIAGVNLNQQEDDVTTILLDLAARDTMNQSRFLANTVVDTFQDHGVDTLDRRPHRSAGFAVLKAVDIPSILVETGYLTNPKEADKLASPEYRRRIAQALHKSIDNYFERIANQ
jgi:N-acetylmuramoyl-L-alanine amidase